jgi:hypothetical protein
LEPEETIRVDSLSTVHTLDWRLTRKKMVETHADTKEVSTPWDRQSFDVPRILEMMMFYGAAEGRLYTRLSHRYQRFVDLSDHITIGRAVLVGRAEQPAAELVRDGQPLNGGDQRWTFFRVIFPVTQGKRSSSP